MIPAWIDALPPRPLCGDEFRNGLYRRPRAEAVRFQHVEFNTDWRVSFLTLDIDRNASEDEWHGRDFPAPTIMTMNPINGHCHIAYQLAHPVTMQIDKAPKAIALLAATQRGMTKRFEADPGYVNRIGKNPENRRWRGRLLAAKPFDLRDLFDRLDPSELKRPTVRTVENGYGRNCDLFDQLRRHAYATVLRAKASGKTRDQFFGRLFVEAQQLNTFVRPLSVREVRAIAKSVANWTWTRFDDGRFSATQAARRRLGAAKAGLTTATQLAGLMAAEADHLS